MKTQNLLKFLIATLALISISYASISLRPAAIITANSSAGINTSASNLSIKISASTNPNTTNSSATTTAGISATSGSNSGSGSSGSNAAAFRAALGAKLNQINNTLLQTSLGQANCKTNFTASYLNQAVQIVPSASASLGGEISTLNQDTAQLETYANSGSVSSYRSYLSGTFDPELASIRGSFKSDVKGNLTFSQKLQLLEAYNSTISQYKQCAYNNLKEFALNKLSFYQTSLALYQSQLGNLSAKGLQTSAMASDISTANSTIVLPFQSAINSATTAAQLQAAINEYCLFDGCQGGLNGHLAARFDSDKLSAVITKLQGYNLTANQSAELDTAQGYATASASDLSSVGTSKYTQSTNPWGDLHNASASLKLVLKG